MDQFYLLGGNTIGEHKSKFNNYVRNLNFLNTSEIIEIITNLKPRNLQEQLFHIKLLSKYEQYDLLLKTLFNGHRIINKIIIKDQKFCKYVVDTTNPNDFVEKICPNISYVTRINLIQNMTWSFEEPADSYFNAIREIYGLSEAVLILPSCTRPLIETILKETKCLIKQKHLIKLHKKFPGIIKFYFENSYDTIFEYKALCSYLVYNDPNALDKIPCYGKRVFLKYFAVKEKDVIENPLDYIKYLKLMNKEMKKKGLSFDVVLKKVFPKKCNEFYLNNNIISILNIYPKHLRASKFLDTYKELYGSTYTEPANARLLDVIYINDCGAFEKHDSYIEYNPLEISIPLIKNKINVTSDVHERSNLLKKLIKTCKLNQSEEALLEVLKYICQRHRNDTELTRQQVLDEVLNNFKIAKLSEEHWHYLKEILLVFKVNNEEYYNHKQYLKIMILRNIENNIDYMNEFKEYLKVNTYYVWNIFPDYPKYQRQLILRYPETLNIENENDLEIKKLEYLQRIVLFNRENENIFINPHDYPELIEIVFKHLKEGDRYLASFCIENIFKYANGFDEKVKIADKYFSISEFYTNDAIYFWVLKFKPDLLISHLESIINNYNNANFYYEINKMHYTKLHELVIRNAMTIFNNKNTKEVKKVIPILCYQLNYLDLIKMYPPLQVDIYDTDAAENIETNRNILISLKNFPIPSHALETIFKYCFKDYLRDALETLYFCSYHCKSSLFKEQIVQLLNRSVTVRKHVIFLTSKLSKLSTKLSLLSHLSKTEENVSIKKYIFTSIFELFLKNQTETTFDLVVKNFILLDENDSESLTMILDINKIPTKFTSSYIQIVWEYLKQKNTGIEIKLLQYIDEEIFETLPKKLCDEILNLTMLKHQDEAENFTFYYLKLSQCHDVFWKAINDYMSTPYENNFGFGMKLKKLKQLFNSFLWNITRCKQESSNQTLSSKLLTGFNNLNLSKNLPLFHLKLDLTNHYVQFGLQAFESYLISKQNEFLGTAMQEIYWECAKDVFDNIRRFDDRQKDQWDSHMQLLEDILTLDQSYGTKMLVLYLMPEPHRKDVAELNRINKMLEIIKQDMNIAIEVYYNRYISQ